MPPIEPVPVLAMQVVASALPFAAYQPRSVTLFVQFTVPLLASASKFCAYVPPLIKIWPETGPAKKTAAVIRPAAQDREIFWVHRVKIMPENSAPFRFALPFLIVTMLRIFLTGQFVRPDGQPGVRREFAPRDVEWSPRHFAHCVFPVRPRQKNWRRLHRTLNQQAQLVPPLRRAGDFFAAPQQIRFFITSETRAWNFCFLLSAFCFPAARRQFRFDFQFRERQPQPVVDAAITFLGLERMPFVAGRENDTVSPVRLVRHDAATGRTADEWTQMRGAFHLGNFLEIAERRTRFRRAVETQHGFLQTRHRLQQRLVQRHVERRAARAGVENEPVLGNGKTDRKSVV